jgi:hypothetical protein
MSPPKQFDASQFKDMNMRLGLKSLTVIAAKSRCGVSEILIEELLVQITILVARLENQRQSIHVLPRRVSLIQDGHAKEFYDHE